MAAPIADTILRLRTAVFTMSDMASEKPSQSYERVRLMAKADALSESLEIAESLLSHITQEEAEAKYDLVKRMIWTDWVDADIILKQFGEEPAQTLALAKAVGTREGFAIGQDYLKNAIAEK